ncbi:MAG: hypothetical protein IJA91_01590 [Clostridia bacterium]|nr:hypothetical protein [Clostridia bacterium]
MKNLFSVNKTYDREANDFDENPYLAARVSDKIQNKMASAFSIVEDEYATHEPTEEEKALKKQGNLYWLLCLGCLVAAAVLFFGGERAGLYTSMPFLHLIDAGLLIASIVFNFKARRISRRQSSLNENNVTVDFTEASKRLEEAAAEAARELGVPEGALSVDILPFHYRIKGDTPVPVGKRNRFDNLSVSMYTEAGHLCLATARELYRVPLSDIRGYREYDEDFEIDMWLKPEDFDSEKYAEFSIRKSGFFARRMHGYYGLDLSGEFEVLIPCYDFAQVKDFLHIPEIS